MRPCRIHAPVSLHLLLDDLVEAGLYALPLTRHLPPGPVLLHQTCYCRPDLLGRERHRLRLVVHLLVMGDATQPPHVLTLFIIGNPQQSAVVVITIGKHLRVVVLLLLHVHRLLHLIGEDDAYAVAADGAVTKHRVRVRLDLLE